MRPLRAGRVSRYRERMLRRDPVTYIGRTNARHLPHKVFGIKQSDRFAHCFLLGRTGTGKTTLIETMAAQDIANDRGVCVIDPHGDLVAKLAARVPERRLADLIYFDAANPNQPYGYNPLRKVSPDKIPLAASGLLGAFQQIWTGRDWGVRLEHILRNTLLALFEYGDTTLADVLRIYADAKFRAAVLSKVTNPVVRSFWFDEFARYSPGQRELAIAPIRNKIGALLADPRLYRIFTKPERDLHLRHVMDQGKILLLSLSKGAMGGDSSRLLGSVMVSMLTVAAFTRIDTLEAERRDFSIYIDESSQVLSLAVASMIAELRKMKIALTLATQTLSGFEPEVRHAVLGNVGTIISFRIGPEDAPVIAKEFDPIFTASDLLNLPNRHIYMKLQIDGAPTRPFSATTLTPEALAHHLEWGR